MTINKVLSFLIFFIIALFVFSNNVLGATDVKGKLSYRTYWTSQGSPYNLTGNVTVLGTLNISPGTVINGNGYKINAIVNAQGTQEKRIVFNDIVIERGTYYGTDGTESSVGDSNTLINVQYSDFNNSVIGYMSTNGYVVMRDSSFNNTPIFNAQYVMIETMSPSYIERNIFNNSLNMNFNLENSQIYIRNNLFYNTSLTLSAYSYPGKAFIEYNSFLNTNQEIIDLRAPQSQINLKNNFWNTVDISLIDNMINDSRQLSTNRAVFEPILFEPNDFTPKVGIKELSFTTSNASIAIVGTPINVNVTSQGGIDPEYRFFLRNTNGELIVLQEYDRNNSIEWIPTQLGEYTIIVHAKDAYKTGGSYFHEARTEFMFSVIPEDRVVGVVSNVNLTSTQDTFQSIGNTIDLLATSEGSNQPEYRFFLRNANGELTVLQEYDSKNSITWIPTQLGEYTIIAHAKDASKNGGSYFHEARKEFRISVIPEDRVVGEVSNINLISTQGTIQKIGDIIDLLVTSEGSNQPEYRFFLRNANGELTVLQEYESKSSMTWIPTQLGEYTIIVHAKDAYKTGSYYFYEARTEIRFSVIP